jgi:hypothetical protein
MRRDSDGKHCFDPACLQLAEHFLPSNASHSLKWDLAQTIQDAVEDYCVVRLTKTGKEKRWPPR